MVVNQRGMTFMARQDLAFDESRHGIANREDVFGEIKGMAAHGVLLGGRVRPAL